MFPMGEVSLLKEIHLLHFQAITFSPSASAQESISHAPELTEFGDRVKEGEEMNDHEISRTLPRFLP